MTPNQEPELTIQDANRICAEFIGTKIIITKARGEKQHDVIKRIIPMHKWGTKEIYDVEFLTSKAKNYYFSYNSFIAGTSWVKSIEVTSEKVRGLSRLKEKPIADYIVEIMTDDSYIFTAKCILALKSEVPGE